MMAGFFRLKFPHLVHAAVSSSSPWLAKLDMQEVRGQGSGLGLGFRS